MEQAQRRGIWIWGRRGDQQICQIISGFATVTAAILISKICSLTTLFNPRYADRVVICLSWSQPEAPDLKMVLIWCQDDNFNVDRYLHCVKGKKCGTRYRGGYRVICPLELTQIEWRSISMRNWCYPSESTELLTELASEETLIGVMKLTTDNWSMPVKLNSIIDISSVDIWRTS